MLSATPLARAQTLNLGDPPPPAAGEFTATRATAQRMRQEAARLLLQAQGLDAADQTLLRAQARWREIAAMLLEHPDPLSDARMVLLGWSVAQHCEQMDGSLMAIVRGEGIAPARRDDAVWELKRFAATPLPEGWDGSSPMGALTFSELRAGIRPLVEALAATVPRDEPLADRAHRALEFVAGDSDLVAMEPALHRQLSLMSRAGWRIEAESALRAQVEFIEAIRLLDETAWLGSTWLQRRAVVCASGVEELVSLPAAPVDDSRPPWRSIAASVRALNELLALPPGQRPRLDVYRRTMVRWLNPPTDISQPVDWTSLCEALATMQRRREAAAAPAHRDLRLTSAALDAQSETLEQMMGDMLERGPSESLRSEPNWATVIGQHRDNLRAREVLHDLPAAIDLLAQFDRRAPTLVWPRLIPDARAIEDARAREQLLRRAEALTAFLNEHGSLTLEAEWRAAPGWLSPLMEDRGAGVIARLDAVRRLRAAELVTEEAAPGIKAELDAMRDLFRFVELWRRLRSGGDLKTGLILPTGLIAAEAGRLEVRLAGLCAMAVRGGGPFVRAMDAARLDSSGAVILGHLLDGAPARSDPLVEAVLDLCRSCEWERAPADAGLHRLHQWCALQFEVHDRPRETGRAAAQTVVYTRFLGERLAASLWDRSR